MVRIGFIGCGGIARHHANCLSQLKDEVEIVANADVSKKARQEFKKQYKTRYATADLGRMLNDDSIDAVYICVPTFLHREMALKAAKAGKHIFLEKPMALKLRDADAIIDAVDRYGVRFLIGFVRRYDNHWGKVRELVKAGVVGAPMIWRTSSIGAGPANMWYCDGKKGMGPLMDGAIHNYDFSLTMFGMASSVFASVHNWRENVKGPDTGTAIIRYPKGNEILLSWSWGCKSVSRFGFNEVAGPDGCIDFIPEPDKLPAGLDKKGLGAVIVNRKGEPHVETFVKNDMFMEQEKHFINVVKGSEKPKITAREGRRSLRIACALFESARKRQAVRI